MSADSELCRQLWAAIEKYPALRVGSVIMSSVHYRWTCIVCVPWDRYGQEVASHDDLAKLVEKLREYERQQIEASKPVPVEAHPSGEIQLGLFA